MTSDVWFWILSYFAIGCIVELMSDYGLKKVNSRGTTKPIMLITIWPIVVVWAVVMMLRGKHG